MPIFTASDLTAVEDLTALIVALTGLIPAITALIVAIRAHNTSTDAKHIAVRALNGAAPTSTPEQAPTSGNTA